MKENLCILTSDNLRNGGEKKHYSACHLSMTETHDEPPAFDIFCKTTPIQKDFFVPWFSQQLNGNDKSIHF